MLAGTRFSAGRWEGDAVVFDLASGDHPGGVQVSAENNARVQYMLFDRPYGIDSALVARQALNADLLRQAQAVARVKIQESLR